MPTETELMLKGYDLTTWLCRTNLFAAACPFLPDGFGLWPRNGYAKGREAIQDRGANLGLCNLPIKPSR